MSDPTTEEWRDLYAAANAFAEIGAWEWFYDSHLFGVQDPESDEVGYCCVMGNLGQQYALGVYLGAEGLAGYNLFANRPDLEEIPSREAIYSQKLLMASWEDRNMLTKRDRDVIKLLGHSYRGRHAWPMFRSYLPHTIAWDIESAEARRLTVALRQAREVSLRFQENPDGLFAHYPAKMLVRVPTADGWVDDWRPPEQYTRPRPAVPTPDPSALDRARAAVKARGSRWEIDFDFFDSPVGGEGRPYIPYLTLIVESQRGLVVAVELTKVADHAEKLQSLVLSAVIRSGAAPSEILVSRDSTMRLLQPVTSALGITLRRAKRLPQLEHARSELTTNLAFRM